MSAPTAATREKGSGTVFDPKQVQELFSGSFRGRPRGRNADSSPSRAATLACHASDPNGWPR